MLKLALLILCFASLLPAQSVVLNWTASTTPGVTGHNVYRSSAQGGPYSEIGTSTATSYTDRTVSYCSKYYYVVTATNAHGESPYSNEASVITGSGFPVVRNPRRGDTLRWNGTKWILIRKR